LSVIASIRAVGHNPSVEQRGYFRTTISTAKKVRTPT
jgi:hypothetical protein